MGATPIVLLLMNASFYEFLLTSISLESRHFCAPGLQPTHPCVEILVKRLQRSRREQLLQEIKEVRQEASEGMIIVGSVDDFIRELER
ncbi:hypothetical protein L2E73_09200 [Planktothrix agardhii 1030]|nr:hypothetical protein [Planktothrix agardhii 1030]